MRSPGSAIFNRMATTAVAVDNRRGLGPSHRRRRPGRPTLLAPGVRDVLLEAVRAGNRPATAARLAGLSPKTLDEWLRRGRSEDVRPATPDYRQLVDDVELAQAQAEARAVDIIAKAMRRNPRWAVWYLENVHPDWRRRRLPPEPAQAAQPVASPSQHVLIVEPELLRRIAMEQLHAKDPDSREWPVVGPGPIRHPLVTDSAAG